MFTFAMLALVTSDNFLQLFFGWEGVGLASYLLIGFWYLKPEANAAAIKAFVVNRVGDFGFALGIFGIFAVFGTIGFDAVFRAAPGIAGKPMEFLGYQWDTLTVLCLLLFMGAMGKSAQFLLHTWLPDAMEGPTPVSALIHAATMVTAGVFMVARLSPLFELAPVALQVVTLVGAVTAFFAATVGLVQNDIKRVVAYSTCSQLGYMFVACGVGAYSAGIFHLFTHAFFKALLFLGSGSVIHAMHHEQDMRKMGGLAGKLKFTYAMMLIGTLALTGVGIPHLIGFAGFYSKDAIIEASFAAHTPNNYAFWLLVIAAFMTAFYSWRLMFMTFHGPTRADHETYEHAHESPLVMLVALAVLALGAVAAGFAFQHFFIGEGYKEFWGKALFEGPGNHILHAMHEIPGWVGWSPTVAMAGRLRASPTSTTSPSPSLPAATARAFRPIYLFLLNKWYFDELYDWHLRAARLLDRPPAVEGRRRQDHRRARPRRRRQPRAVDHGPHRQAADRLRLPLRLRHADRRGADHHLVHVLRRSGAMNTGFGLLSLVTFFPLVGRARSSPRSTRRPRATRAGSRSTPRSSRSAPRSTCGASSIPPSTASSSSRRWTGSAAPSNTRWASTASPCCSWCSPRS